MLMGRSCEDFAGRIVLVFIIANEISKTSEHCSY